MRFLSFLPLRNYSTASFSLRKNIPDVFVPGIVLHYSVEILTLAVASPGKVGLVVFSPLLAV
jgi:hypothetical protein